MRKVILMMLLAVVSRGAAAEWVKVGTNELATIYADLATVRKDGDIVTMWDMYDLKTLAHTSSGKPFMSAKGQREYDCRQGTSRVLSSSFHSGNLNEGTVVDSASSIPSNWGPVTPGNSNELLWKVACGKPAINIEAAKSKGGANAPDSNNSQQSIEQINRTLVGRWAIRKLCLDPRQDAFGIFYELDSAGQLTSHVVGTKDGKVATLRKSTYTDVSIVDVNESIYRMISNVDDFENNAKLKKITLSEIRNNHIRVLQAEINGHQTIKNGVELSKNQPVESSVKCDSPEILAERQSTNTQQQSQPQAPVVALGIDRFLVPPKPQVKQHSPTSIEDFHRMVIEAASLADLTKSGEAIYKLFEGHRRWLRDYYPGLRKCHQLQGPDGFLSLAQLLVEMLNSAEPPDDEQRLRFESGFNGFQQLCPEEAMKGKALLDDLARRLGPVHEQRVAELERQNVEKQDKARQLAEAQAQKKAAREAREKANREEQEKNQITRAKERAEYARQFNERLNQIRMGKASVQSIDEATALHNAQNGAMLVVQPPLKADKKFYRVQGILQRWNESIIVASWGNNVFAAYVTKNTSFLSGAEEKLHAGSIVQVVGRFERLDDGGQGMYPVFSAAYISP